MGQTGSRELGALRERVAAWRKQGGGRGSRIPEALWDEAVRVARDAGLYATARAARFNYERLKARSGKADGRGADTAITAVSTGAEQRAALVLAHGKRHAATATAHRVAARGARVGDGARFLALPVAPVHAGRQTIIELHGRRGERMRVDVTGDVDVAAVVPAFWRRPS